MNEDKLVIIEKYEEFINYIYPILQNIQRKHGILKEKIIQTIFLQPELFSKIFLKLEFSKWQIANLKNKLLNFLGYRISGAFKLIRKSSIIKAKRKIKFFAKRNLLDKLLIFLASWRSHLLLADSWNLKKFILFKEEELWKNKLICRSSTVLLN